MKIGLELCVILALSPAAIAQRGRFPEKGIGIKFK